MRTRTTADVQPDYIKLPKEYASVIVVLKKREEKAHLIMALNELGDLRAHFSQWQVRSQQRRGCL